MTSLGEHAEAIMALCRSRGLSVASTAEVIAGALGKIAVLYAHEADGRPGLVSLSYGISMNGPDGRPYVVAVDATAKIAEPPEPAGPRKVS